MNVALACKPSSSQVKAVVMDVRFYIHTIHIFYIFIHEWIHFCCFSNFISCGGHPKTVRCIVFCVLCMLNTKKRKKSNCDDVNMARSTWAAACNFSGGGTEDIIHTDHLYWATDNSVNWPNCGSRTKRPHSYQTKKNEFLNSICETFTEFLMWRIVIFHPARDASAHYGRNGFCHQCRH